MSVSEHPTAQSAPATPAPASGIADPGPLGLAAFALTTFLLSAANAHWMTHATGAAWLGFALAYGGLAQLLAAMWEFRNRNVVGATGFGTFAAFWLGFAFWLLLVVRPALAAAAAHPLTLPATVASINHDQGWILLGFLIFTTYVVILVTQTNTALFTVFFLLWLTILFLMIANFNLGSASTSGLLQFGGYLGLVTALAAWYTSMAGMAKFMGGRIQFPVGPPLIKP